MPKFTASGVKKKPQIRLVAMTSAVSPASQGRTRPENHMNFTGFAHSQSQLMLSRACLVRLGALMGFSYVGPPAPARAGLSHYRRLILSAAAAAKGRSATEASVMPASIMSGVVLSNPSIARVAASAPKMSVGM